MGKRILSAILAAGLGLAVVSCEKQELPQEFNSISPIAKECLMAAVYEKNFEAYKVAINSVDNPELKTKIAEYASSNLYKNAQTDRSTFDALELAIELGPTQKDREFFIDQGMGTADFYGAKKDTHYPPLAAHFLAVCAKYTSSSDRRNEFLNRASDIYEAVAGRVSSHTESAKYLLLAQDLREGKYHWLKYLREGKF